MITRDEIIRMALSDPMLIEGIESLAREAYAAGAAAEREACAKAAASADLYSGDMLLNSDIRETCAAAIRARSAK
jgi:hypothetical protein